MSIGSGFRGGLFFASLFLGAMVGKLFAGLLAMITTTHAIPPVVCAIVAMSGMAVAIIGGPLTMGFLALEETGSLPMTVAVLAACVISSLTVRRTFGYSFATWRFHLRGESIRSAVDVGWMRNLTVGRMMRREVRTVRADTPLAIFRRDFPLGATQRVVAVDEADRYAGIVLLAEAHADAGEGARIADILHYADAALLPQMTVKQAIGLFENAESDALAVLDGPETKRVIGLLTEQFALRRYSEELDRRRRELSGEYGAPGRFRSRSGTRNALRGRLRLPRQARAVAQQVADFRQQQFGLRERRRRRLLLRDEARHRFHDPEDDKGDDDELDDRVDEQADIHGRRARPGCLIERIVMLAVQAEEDVAEIDAASEQAQHRVEYVLDQTIHDTCERRANDDADRQIDDIPAHDERAELAQPGRSFRDMDRSLHDIFLLSGPPFGSLIYRLEKKSQDDAPKLLAR